MCGAEFAFRPALRDGAHMCGRGPRVSLRFTRGSFENTLGGIDQGVRRSYSQRPSGALLRFGLLTQDCATLHPGLFSFAPSGRIALGGMAAVAPLRFSERIALPGGSITTPRPPFLGSTPYALFFTSEFAPLAAVC